MIKIPQNGQYLQQPNNSDVLGDIWSSFNIDQTENEGRLRAGKKMIMNTSTNEVSELNCYPASFTKCGTNLYAFAGLSGGSGYAFKNDGTMIGTFAKETDSNAPQNFDSTKGDSIFYNNAMYAYDQSSGFIKVCKKVGNLAWSTPFVTSSLNIYPTCFAGYKGRVYFSAYFSTIRSWDSSDTVATLGNTYTLTINQVGDFSNMITKIIPADDRIFILTANQTGGKGHVYEWDGSSATTVSYTHRLESSGALTGTILEGVCYIMDTNGSLLYWNGGTFKKIAELNRENNLPLYNPLSDVNDRFVHPNGMSVVNGKIQVFINNLNYDYTGTIEETINSGVYEFDPENPAKGLYHVGSVSTDKAGDSIKDYGQIRIAGAGALKEMGVVSNASGANGRVFIGSGIYNGSLVAKYGIFYDDRNDTLQKMGNIITRKLQAQGDKLGDALTNTWASIYTFKRKFLNATDKIYLKYRTVDIAPTEATITWTSANTFTTTTDVSAYWTVGTGGEVEVVQGVGSGKTSHITSIVNNSGTYTVTVDESYTGWTGQGKARFQHWIKLKPITGQLDTSTQTPINATSSWIQFKVCLLFTGKNEVEKFIIINKTNTITS